MGHGTIQNTKPNLVINGRLYDFLEAGGVTTLSIAGAAAYYSSSIILPKNSIFGWEVQFTSGGVINVKVELEQSMDGSNFVIPDNKTSPMFSAVVNNSFHQTAYSPVATPYARLKLTGLAGNAASTVLAKAVMYAVRT